LTLQESIQELKASKRALVAWGAGVFAAVATAWELARAFLLK
jgi:hypothetical protein